MLDPFPRLSQYLEPPVHPAVEKGAPAPTDDGPREPDRSVRDEHAASRTPDSTMLKPSQMEASRLELLRMLEILDSTAEPSFDALVRTASLVCHCPISLMSLIDVDRQWFKAAEGLDARETPRDQAFCAHAIQSDRLFEINDAMHDDRFARNPLVTGAPHIRFYAGQPIVFQGVALGTLCVIDRVPRELSAEQRTILEHLSLAAGELLQGRMDAISRERESRRMQSFAALSGDWLWESDAVHRCTWSSGDATRVTGLFDGVIAGRRFRDVPVFAGAGDDLGLHDLLERGEPFAQVVVETTTHEGRRFIALTGVPLLGFDGGFEGFRGSARDVTARVEADVVARRYDADLAKITRNVPGLIYQFRYYLDGTSSFPYASDGMRDLFETDPETARNDASGVVGRIHPDDVVDVLDRIRASVVTGGIWDARFRVKLPSKGTRWLQGSAIPERLDDGSTLWHGYITDVTESHARDRDLVDAHRALQVSESRLRALMDNLPALIAHVDADETYTYANATDTRMFGGDATRMVGRSVREIRGDEVYRDIKPYMDRALAGEAVSFEGSGVIAGVVRHYQATYVPDTGPDGERRGFHSISFDVTDRKQAELQVVASERLLRGIADNLPALVGYIDTDRRYRFANASYRTWLGLDHVAMIGERVDDLFDEATLRIVRPWLERALAGEPVTFERQDRTDGRDAYYIVDYLPDTDDAGVVQGLYAMTTDITARRRAEVELAASLADLQEAEQARQRSEHRLRDITDSLPVLIAYLDADQRMTYANDTFLATVGETREFLIGRHAIDAIGPEMYAQRAGQIAQCLAGERVDFEVQSMSQGAMKHLRATYLPDTRQDGRVVGMTMLSIDVTDLKAAELRLSRLAHYDELTGLPNRLLFNQRLADAVSTSDARRGLRAVMFLDVDHFKSINDTRGHAVGDRVLQRFAERLKSSLRDTAFVARLSGDEFVVILDDLADVEDAGDIARKLVDQVRRPFRIDGDLLQVTTSIGVVNLDRTIDDAADVMARADQALYRAKQAGRDTCRVFG